jgi:hypothetical protein
MATNSAVRPEPNATGTTTKTAPNANASRLEIAADQGERMVEREAPEPTEFDQLAGPMIGLPALDRGQLGKHLLLFAFPSHLNSLAMQSHQVNTPLAADSISSPARAASTVTTESGGRSGVLSGRCD